MLHQIGQKTDATETCEVCQQTGEVSPGKWFPATFHREVSPQVCGCGRGQWLEEYLELNLPYGKHLIDLTAEAVESITQKAKTRYHQMKPCWKNVSCDDMGRRPGYYCVTYDDTPNRWNRTKMEYVRRTPRNAKACRKCLEYRRQQIEKKEDRFCINGRPGHVSRRIKEIRDSDGVFHMEEFPAPAKGQKCVVCKVLLHVEALPCRACQKSMCFRCNNNEHNEVLY